LVHTTPVGEEVYDALTRFYKSVQDAPPYEEAIEGLAAESATTRGQSAERLVTLLDQTVADERSGRSSQADGLRPGPQDNAAMLRGWVASVLADRLGVPEGTAEALGPARWLVERDPAPDHRTWGMQVVAQVRSAGADGVVLAHLDDPVPAVLAIAAREVGRRGLRVVDGRIRTLCVHWSKAVREASRATAGELGLRELPEWAPERGLTPRVEEQIRLWSVMAVDRPTEDAVWMRFETQEPEGSMFLPGGDQSGTGDFSGWLLRRDERCIEVIDWFGERRKLNPGVTRVFEDTLAETAQRLIGKRTGFNSGETGSFKQELGVLPAFRWSGEPEALIAAWAFAGGDPRTAAILVLPHVEAAESEVQFFEDVRHLLGTRADRRMLAAFTGRDYAEAIRIAGIISAPAYDGFWHQDRAKALREQLPQRGDDFKELRLPKPPEWAARRAKMTRQEQIAFLAQRLRLLSCWQMSSPGWIDYADKQYEPVPEGEEQDRERMEEYWKQMEERVLINPYVELVHLNLNGGELTTLLPLLESSDYILAFDHQRFMPHAPMNLHRVSWVVASVVNQVAQTQLVDLRILENGTPDERKKHLAEVSAWCRENSDGTLVDHLANTVAKAKEWNTVKGAFWNLRTLDERRLVGSIVLRVASDAEHRADLVHALALLRAPEGVPIARRWLGDGDGDLRFWSAVTLLHMGDRMKGEGLDAFTRTISRERDGAARLELVIDDLLALDDSAVKRSVLAAGPGADDESAPSLFILQRLMLAGHEGAYRALLRGLDGKCAIGLCVNHPFASGPLSTDDLALAIHDWKPDAEPVAWEERESRAAEIRKAGRAWLEATWADVEAGRTPEVERMYPPDPWGDLGRISTGWIRRL
jgi:hypothetical protein